MKKKLALWIGLAVFCITICDPWLAAFACRGGRMRQGRPMATTDTSGVAAPAPVASRGYITYARMDSKSPWSAIGHYRRYDDAVRAMRDARSQGLESFAR